MKICGVVVLYNPTKDVIRNIYTYLEIVDEIILFDNSDKIKINQEELNKIERMKKIKYISYGKNKGIAFALKESMKYVISKEYDWCLTMDQDSYLNITKEKIQQVREALEENKEYGIISFDYNKENNDNDEIKIRIEKKWITSGNFINVEQYKKVEGFNEKLFIDFVDFDFNRQLYEKNIKIGVMNYSIKHSIGNPIKVNFGNFNIIAMNHSLIRYYYRYRNCVYLYRKNRKYYLKTTIYEFTVNLIKMLIFEDNSKEKLKMIKYGINDAKKGKLGIYKYEGEK